MVRTGPDQTGHHTTPHHISEVTPALGEPPECTASVEHIMTTKNARFEFRTTQEFIDKLASVSQRSGLSKPEAIGAGIELLERLVEADREGKEIAFVEKHKTSNDK